MEAQPQGPMLLAERSATVGSGASLWSSSRPWRVLVVSSCLLTSLAISAPLVLPQVATGPSAQGSCSLQIARTPVQVFGRVVAAFVPEDQVLSITRTVETQLGAKISPGYLSMRRVGVLPANGDRPTIAGVPDNVTAPKVGDLVVLNSRYRDPNLPCNFVPWTVNRVLKSVEAD